MRPLRPYDMSERSDRLRRAFAEFKAGGLAQTEAVERWGWNKNTLKSNLNGNVDFSFAKARVYGARLKVRAEWLYDGVDPMREASKRSSRPPIEVPVLSWVSAGRVSDVGDIEDLSEAERMIFSGLPAGTYFATEVVGDSMDRISPEGSRIVINADDRTPKSGQCYLFSRNGEATYKRYQARPVKRLEPVSTNPANEIIFLAKDEDWSVIGRVRRSIYDLD